MSKDKPADHDKTNRVFTTLREGPHGRLGLTGAAPVGNRWRAQGFISGSVRYLGTFDSEQEAHEAYMTARKANDDAKEQAESEWMANAPLYIYAGGIGRGARLNGRSFKLVNDELPQHLIVREISDDGTQLGNPVTLSRKYLHRVEVEVEATPEPGGTQPAPQDLVVEEVPPDTDVDAFEAALKVMSALGDDEALVGLPPKVAAAIVKAREHLREGTRESREAKAARDSLKHEVVDAVFGARTRTLGDKDRVLKWLLTHIPHMTTDYSPTVVALRMVQGTVNHEQAVNFLKEHTNIPHDVLDEVLGETVGQVFTRDSDPSPELVKHINRG
ncbi:hypothetical protein N9917_00960 [Deltaproteobacteria bacterium]|nr:hypothetical protein [Deltaproteobacteria bacterium]